MAQYMRWKLTKVMGKMMRLYLSMSLARIPNIRSGGGTGAGRGGGGAGAGGTTAPRTKQKHWCKMKVMKFIPLVELSL